jgi:cobyrinic acid a,c-diamide synthase
VTPELGQRHIPRLVIAAPQGRSGKTTVTLGLAAALAARGLSVYPFKKGPDYIDPSWLAAAAGRPCRSLDPFFMPAPDALRDALLRPLPWAPAPSEIALIEGNHGLFDDGGASDDSAEGATSTAAVGRTLSAPVILVLNAARTGRSAAAIVLGCLHFEPGTRIAGVILNRVAGARHEAKLRQAIERYCGIPVLGALPANPALTVPDRHLGLVPVGEEDRNAAAIEACREAAEQGCALDALLAVAASAPALPTGPLRPDFAVPHRAFARIGVFRDRAFSFYYHENLEALVDAGAELVPLNSLREAELPSVDALYIGGGFPEVFMAELSANRGLLAAVRRAAQQGMPVYAECGGLMYLSRAIRWGERRAEMAGVLPFEVEMAPRPQGHGYVSARVERPNSIFEQGVSVRGHEFHNSRLVDITGNLELAYRLERGKGAGDGRDGVVYGNVLASYTHLHAAAAPGWAEGFVRRAAGNVDNA